MIRFWFRVFKNKYHLAAGRILFIKDYFSKRNKKKTAIIKRKFVFDISFNLQEIEKREKKNLSIKLLQYIV
jgi:hypothetical protein